MKNYAEFYIGKTTQTFADVLVTFGLAKVLSELLSQQTDNVGTVTITDQGAYYRLACQPPLEQATIDHLASPICPIGFIRTPKNVDKQPVGLPFMDYEQIKEETNQFYEARKKGAEGEKLPPKPRDWDILRAINPAALPGYNGLVEAWWTTRQAQPQILTLLFELYGSPVNDLDAAQEIWKKLDKANGWGIKAAATGQQLYNPDQGKGQNRIKADGLSIGNMDGFWLTEWLKAVGFYEAAMTRLVSGAKDRKTFVVAPRELSFDDSRAVMSAFMDTMTSESSTRFDILAAIRYTRALLEHFTSDESRLAKLLALKNIKKKVVAGFHIAFYKDLGNAVATMNIAFIALPGWVEVQSRDDVALYTDPNHGLLTELEKVTRQFDESHSDAFTLLQHLRDFVSGDNLKAFLRFSTRYADYYIRKYEQNRWLRPLSTEFVERIITTMGKKYADIADRKKYPGFHNIAAAIAESTVWAQWRKSTNTTYQIRYGLHRDLARQTQTPEKFLKALGEFIHTYNSEAMRAKELNLKPSRTLVNPDDISDILRMIDEYQDVQMITEILLAYGSGFMKFSHNETDKQENEE